MRCDMWWPGSARKRKNMAESISDIFADKFVGRTLRLNRFAEGQRQVVFGLLQNIETELSGHMKDFDPSAVRGVKFRQNRLTKLMESVQESIAAGYKDIARQQAGALTDLAHTEAATVAGIVNGVMDVDILTVTSSDATIRALLNDTMVEGAPVQEWWGRQAQVTRDRFRDEMRKGLFQGDGLNDLLKRVRGTRANQFKDGIMGITRKNAERLVRTSINSISNAARMEMFTANSDIINGVQALVTLDNRTSLLCISRSGASWDMKTGAPLPGSSTQIQFPGSPPWHWHCRSILIPVLKSFEEMLGAKGKRFDQKLEKLGPGTQASMDGQVAGDMTFDGWLKKQSATPVNEVLGPGRAELWRSGKLALADLVNQNGRPLTLVQLREA